VKYVIFISTVLLTPINSTATDNVTFQPDGEESKDTFIVSYNPEDNWGDGTGMVFGHAAGDCWDMTLIQFTGLNDYIGADIFYAELTLWVEFIEGELANDNFVAPVGSYWEENTVTWNTRPGRVSPEINFREPTVEDYLVIDVTEIVKKWCDSTLSNYGFYIYTGEEPYLGFCSLCTGEHWTVAHRPKLLIEYQFTGIEPESLGEIKAGFR
jgi:hypothetical protein